MLPAFNDYKRVFLETTKSEHDHGGAGWEFGTCLWSPVRNASGARFYEIMKEPNAGDLVLHNYHYSPDGRTARSYLTGYSIVDQPAAISTDEPPNAGVWQGRGQYYRIELRDYSQIDAPLDFRVFSKNYAERLRDELDYHLPKFFPFTISGGTVRLNQGMYLTRIPRILYSTLLEALGVEGSQISAKEKTRAHRTYAEGERYRREVSYFLRNPKLAEDAKEHFEYTCQICGFSPQKIYGKRHSTTGLDCHHLDPLAGRSGYTAESTLNDVTVLCANCHRLVHSKRKALKISEAKALFKKTPFTLGEGL